MVITQTLSSGCRCGKNDDKTNLERQNSATNLINKRLISVPRHWQRPPFSSQHQQLHQRLMCKTSLVTRVLSVENCDATFSLQMEKRRLTEQRISKDLETWNEDENVSISFKWEVLAASIHQMDPVRALERIGQYFGAPEHTNNSYRGWWWLWILYREERSSKCLI